MSSLKEKKKSTFTVWNMVSECPVNKKGYVQETKPSLGTMQSYMRASYLSLPKHQAQKKYHLKSSPVELLSQMVKCFAAEFPSGCRTFTCQFLQESPCDRKSHQFLQNLSFYFYEIASYSKTDFALSFIHTQSCLSLLKVTAFHARKCSILTLVNRELLTLS